MEGQGFLLHLQREMSKVNFFRFLRTHIAVIGVDYAHVLCVNVRLHHTNEDSCFMSDHPPKKG